MNRDILRQFAVIFTFIGTIVLNAYATIGRLGGRDTGEISDSFPNFFTPAGYVFSIWSVIYLFLAIFVVYQALPAKRQDLTLRRIGWLFVLTNVLNAAWIVSWHYLLIPLSVVIMLALLATLLTIYTRLDIGKVTDPTAQRWIVTLPFRIYSAWISVATIANTTVLLVYLGFQGGPIAPPVWSAIVLVVGAVIAAAVVYPRRDWAYAAVFVWAYIGIIVKYMGTDIVVYTAGAMVAVIVIALVASFIRNPAPVQRLQHTS